MNTLKKCILLMVLTINLMPYMQDGQIKWTTSDAAAQQFYTEEIITPGLEWLCGESAYLYDESYFFNSDIKCEKRTSRPEAESTTTPLTDCNLQKTFTFDMGVNPSVEDLGKKHWCVFYCIQAVKGRTICDWAELYYRAHFNLNGVSQADVCKLDTGVYTDEIKNYLNLKSTNAVGIGGLLKELMSLGGECDGNGKGLLQHTTTSTGEPHVVLMHGFQKRNEIDPVESIIVQFFDTDRTDNWNQGCLASKLNWSKIFDIVIK